MKRGKILSLCLLSLFLISAAVPTILANSNIEATKQTATIYQMLINDKNGDKIQDEFLSDIEAKDETIIEAVVLFDHKITDLDKYRLTQIGASISSDVWDLGHRILITTHSDNLERIADMSGISLITFADKRTITIAIDGNDFSDLALLEQYEGSQIFWGIGCAIIKYYSGIENDINLLGDFTVIADVTDVRYNVERTIDNPEQIEFGMETLETAGQINATGLWDEGYEGSGVVIGIIDTGINSAHPDIAGRILDAESFVLEIYGADADDLTTDDISGHGSHVAGIAAGDGTVQAANVGMAPDADICMAKILPSSPMEMILAGLDWLVDDKIVDVINFSFGAAGRTWIDPDPMEIAFGNVAKNDGILSSHSAGNEAYDGFYTISTPATSDDVITVGNLDTTGLPFQIAQTSSKGLTPTNHLKPDVLAPGTDILSLSQIGSNYISRGGTSMAAPHVTGAIALLIEACDDQSIPVNVGVLKGALMHTAVPLDYENTFAENLGMIDVGQAWHLLKNAAIVDGYPLVGAGSPNELPLPWWETLIQGQIAENFFTVVSPYKNSLSLDISGTAAPYITYELVQTHYTSIFRVVFNITGDTPLGIYTGEIDFKYKTNVLDTVDIDFEVTSGLGKRMLLNFRTTNWAQDHEKFGQYVPFIDDLYSLGYSICEENVYLDSGVLDQYDAVWLPDPFSIFFPDRFEEDLTDMTTWNPWTASEKTALTSYVESGGTVFICTNGYSEEIEADPHGLVPVGTNISAVNEWTAQWGITMTDEIYAGTNPGVVAMKSIHALAQDVDAIDHFGAKLVVTGEATILTETTTGSQYDCLAIYQDDSGGRVIVQSTNFNLDSQGYINGYNSGYTQNDVFGQNLVRWATAEHRIRRQNITSVEKTITLRYEYLAGPGADFSGYVVRPDLTQEDLVWTEITTGIWEATIENAKEGDHEFYVECGTTGVDDFDYIKYYYVKSGGLGLESLYVVLIGAFGLAGWYFIQKIRKNKS
ncbi:MAG: S8 family serine peptidase [Asgard group archaeon]|nr:S8 family serine peptidase [Asgard group archaeon]